jgi:hypothetical protein
LGAVFKILSATLVSSSRPWKYSWEDHAPPSRDGFREELIRGEMGSLKNLSKERRPPRRRKIPGEEL